MSHFRAVGPAGWRKSSHSIGTGDCVETAVQVGMIAVRDSKDPSGEVLRYSASAWRSFVAKMKQGTSVS